MWPASKSVLFTKFDWDHKISNHGTCQTCSPSTPRVNGYLNLVVIHEGTPLGLYVTYAQKCGYNKIGLNSPYSWHMYCKFGPIQTVPWLAEVHCRQVLRHLLHILMPLPPYPFKTGLDAPQNRYWFTAQKNYSWSYSVPKTFPQVRSWSFVVRCISYRSKHTARISRVSRHPHIPPSPTKYYHQLLAHISN